MNQKRWLRHDSAGVLLSWRLGHPHWSRTQHKLVASLGPVLDHQLRLFLCACFRHVSCWPWSTLPTPARQVLAALESKINVGTLTADNMTTASDYLAAIQAVMADPHQENSFQLARLVCQPASELASELASLPLGILYINMADILREILGNPFARQEAWTTCPNKRGQPSAVPATGWEFLLDPQVERLARGLYRECEECDWEALPILADALEDAGCTDQGLLTHLRGWQTCPACLGTGTQDVREESSAARPTSRQKKTRAGLRGAGKAARQHASTLRLCETCCGERQVPLPDLEARNRGPAHGHTLGCWALELVRGPRENHCAGDTRCS